MVTTPETPRRWRATSVAGVLALVCTACAPAPQDPAVVALCDDVGLLASNIMGLRQAGYERERLEATARDPEKMGSDIQDLTMAIIDTAFGGWKIVPKPNRPQTIAQFGDSWRQVCLSGGKHGPRLAPKVTDEE